MSGNKYALEANNLTKQFPGVLALEKVDFCLRPGSVHGLVGKNGAGKSTLVNILSGMFPPSSGDILIHGEKIFHLNPHLALKQGIAVIPQEPRIAPTLTVAENLFLGVLPKSDYGFIDWVTINKRAQEVVEKMELDIDINSRVEELTIADRQLLTTAKAFFVLDPKVVIMDEVTAALSDAEERMLYKMIEKKKADGAGIVFISHELEEIFEICDYVTVLRDGKIVATEKVASLTHQKLVEHIVGEKVSLYTKEQKKTQTILKEAVSVEGLNYQKTLKNISFKINEGEVVGIAGLRGSGRTELLKTIFGLLKKDSGIIKLKGKKIDITNSSKALEQGIFYLPEDREKEGLLTTRSVKENFSISSLQKYLKKFGFIDHSGEFDTISGMSRRLKVATPSLQQEIRFLSGGNKQKVILGRGLLTKPSLILLDEPTKGIDLETKMEIRKIIVELSKSSSIILVSSEFEDLLAVCDRILVMRNGEIVENLEVQDMSEAALHNYVGGIQE